MQFYDLFVLFNFTKVIPHNLCLKVHTYGQKRACCSRLMKIGFNNVHAAPMNIVVNNVDETKSSAVTFCSFHAMTSSVIYYRTHAPQNEIYLFYTSILLFSHKQWQNGFFCRIHLRFVLKQRRNFSSHQSGINSACDVFFHIFL